MRTNRTIFLILLGWILSAHSTAEKWISHFAYNNVTQIAMSPDHVYAVSDGSLYSVDKMTEQITVYNRQSGLNGMDITCIGYDEVDGQLIIGYETGKIDILTSTGVKYIGELYDKDMTQRKTIHNITFVGRTAYLSTHYGVQTLDLRGHKLVDSYWLRPDGEETPVEDVLLTNDSIYAFTTDSLFCAALTDNIVDYTYWKRERRSGRIAPDANKGKHYQDASSHWYAGGAEGIVRVTATERNTYKPQGPLVNMPYRLNAKDGTVWMVPGGRWSSQNSNPGIIMRYDGEQWTNISTGVIQAQTGKPVLDFMNTAADPRDINHYYVTSYGTGLYVFRNDSLVRHDVAGTNNSLVAIAPNSPDTYTRLDYATYDADNNLWMMDAALSSQLQCIDASGNWHAVTMLNEGSPIAFHTPGGLIIDHRNPNYKWMSTARYNTLLCLLDDGGTRWDSSDDQTTVRSRWIDQNGKTFVPEKITDMMQDREGRIWLATDLGAAYIDTATNFKLSDVILRPDIMDDNGEHPITEQAVSTLCEDRDGNIWIGTNALGVYVLNPSATEIIAHYTTDNTTMPSNTILSLAFDGISSVYVGTGGGLCQYDPDATPESNDRTKDQDGRRLGSIMQWKLHFSYRNPQEIAPSASRIYAIANGSLFYVDRSSDRIDYITKANGLNGSTIAHIGYDAASGQLIIAYEDGRIDLLDNNDNVRQIPDLYMKAGSVSVTTNSISVGSHYTYLAMPFGIVVINPKKAEIKETYYVDRRYIKNSSGDSVPVDVEILQVVELNDSLYAFADGSFYCGGLKDNLLDYSYWHKRGLPSGKVSQTAAFNDQLHMLLDNHLYCLQNGQWIAKITDKDLQWIHKADGKLLTYIEGQGLFAIEDDYRLTGLSNNYTLNDAVYTRGEYWAAQTNSGLIRLSTSGDDFFIPDGPNSNFGYFVRAAHQRIYSTIGGRWAGEYERLAQCNIYDGHSWYSISHADFTDPLQKWIRDPVSIAIDPQDPGHFYVATYGTGVIEFVNYKASAVHTWYNSTLKPVQESSSLDPDFFTRTDGAMMDADGNLWVLNATEVGVPIHVMTPDHTWYGLSLREGSKKLVLITPTGIWTDNRNSRYKWFMDQRYTPGLILLNDGGTPTKNSDDRSIKRSSFVDQNGKTITPDRFYCFAQDHNDRIWIGTGSGIFNIMPETDFFSSNAVQRIIIPRNDGTGLGDYLLGDEQINCMAVDGGNRMWIGTASSGLYVIEDDTITVAHFTEDNSLLPSNNILSLAIIPETGNVFAGTDKGIASYLSDASEPNENMKNAYAYPNPVPPDYGGMISITGLMDNSEIRIIDAGGNLVCKTRSHGGTAVWDGKLADGRRATAGVYTALCNTKGGHTAVKILIIR